MIVTLSIQYIHTYIHAYIITTTEKSQPKPTLANCGLLVGWLVGGLLFKYRSTRQIVQTLAVSHTLYNDITLHFCLLSYQLLVTEK